MQAVLPYQVLPSRLSENEGRRPVRREASRARIAKMAELRRPQRRMGFDLGRPEPKIAENPPEIAKWDTLSTDAKKVLSRQMEV
jgi:hypothetical protein